MSKLSPQNVTSDEPSPDDPKRRVVTFGQTPVMSTYLLAFVVGEFDYVEGKSLDNVVVRVYTPLTKKEQGQFALEVGQTIARLVQSWESLRSHHVSHIF